MACVYGMACVLLSFVGVVIISTGSNVATHGHERGSTAAADPSVVTVNAADSKVQVCHDGQWSSICEPSVVSVNEADGKVQVFHDGQWSSICGHLWDNRDAQVVCRMEGYWHGRGVADLRPVGSREVILLDSVNCSGREDTLDHCAFRGWTPQPCDIHQVAAVNCDTSGSDRIQVRLVEGYGPFEGRLEVQVEGEGGGRWGPVCHHGFDDLDAQVVCRMLGLRSDGGKAHAEPKFPQSNLPPLIHQLDCTGQEVNIAQCKGKQGGTAENCTDVGVECYNCGGMFITPNGTLQSENYPLNYPTNQNCLYLIQPTNQQQLYKLDFANFSTEACCDTLDVKVQTADSQLSGGTKYSGSNSPPHLLGKAFALTFVTDGSHSMQGFRASWSPARVQDVTSVTCEGGQFRVDIDLGLLKQLSPDSNPRTISLANPGCTGAVVSRDGHEHLVILANTASCGSLVSTNDSSITYHNFLVDRVYAEDSRLIVRSHRWKIPIFCQVDTTHTFKIHYNPLPELRKREAEMPDSTAHARNRQVTGSLTVVGHFPIEIKAYKDRTYTVLEYPVRRRLGDDLDLRMEMTPGDLGLKLVLRNCSTSPEYYSSSHLYYIIRQGCAVDSQTEILHTRQHSTDFRFNVFEFAGNSDVVFIDCYVTVCSANDNSAECTQQCGSSSVPLVGKRSVSEPIINRVTRPELYGVTFGPIVVES